MPRKTGTRSKPRTRPAATRRVSELERDVSALSVDESPAADDEAIEEAADDETIEEAADETLDKTQDGRMQTRQATDPERRQTLQRLMTAIRSGEFDDELGEPGRETRAKGHRARRLRRRGQRGEGSDSDYEQNEEANEDDDADYEDEGGDRLQTTEKRLILKFKTANIDRAAGSSAPEQAPQLEDIDWSEFDLETINGILERREALRRRRGQQRGLAGGAVTTATLKKSSLAPAPLQLDRAPGEVAGDEEGAIFDDEEEVLMSRNVYEMDVDAEEPEFSDLFEDANDVAEPPGAALHLPPRASALSTDLPRHARPHPALIRNMADAHAHADKDMRIVLQYELRSEETMLKDLRAEIADKLLKLQAEEKLLRMVVKRDFELPEDESPAQAQIPEPFGAFEADARDEEPGAMPMDAEDEGSVSDGSLSGMSSSSSEDDVQSDELTRGALSQMLRTYLPSGEMDGLGPDS
ncbi:hypothetical protein IWW50_002005 [Coemansia erecta]|nr:hypothetical protein IWW50_002005 [Coemansia erecta]